ncbi:MAG TPA: type II toxin-antitoxin system RelE/ParE family toxin, partial [Salinimicrobium sp.]|nr:type II toxin-antitoxin system RelE/ParE family toxin [Salinimicrobium sp.]
FSKSIDKIKNRKILSKIESIILACENSEDIKNIPNIKKLVGFKDYYRIKSGNYRIGVEIEKNTIRFITVLHRKDIYQRFP